MSKKNFTNYYLPSSGAAFGFFDTLEHSEESSHENDWEEDEELKQNDVHIGIWEALKPNKDLCDLCDDLNISDLSIQECLEMLEDQKET